MPEEDGVERRHAEPRWLALRLDDDVKELRADMKEV